MNPPQSGAGLAIEVRELVKTFGAFRALDGLDLEVRRGEVHGFVGPNGAGKSTTIRVLLGMLRHDSGTVRLLGGDPWNDAVELHRRLAYVPGDVNLWPKLTGGEIIDLLGRMRGGLDPARRDELIERFELDPTKKARTYSKGNRQKVGLVAALSSNVELLVLDEPTAGLDPLMEAEFRDVIRDVKHAGNTVLLSSHILAEVEALCDRLSIIRKGRTVESASLTEMQHVGHTSVTAHTERSVDMTGVPGVIGVERDETRIAFDVDNAHLGEALDRLAQASITALTCTPPTLEELFLRHYDDDASPDGASDAPDGGRQVSPDAASEVRERADDDADPRLRSGVREGSGGDADEVP